MAKSVVLAGPGAAIPDHPAVPAHFEAGGEEGSPTCTQVHGRQDAQGVQAPVCGPALLLQRNRTKAEPGVYLLLGVAEVPAGGQLFVPPSARHLQPLVLMQE